VVIISGVGGLNSLTIPYKSSKKSKYILCKFVLIIMVSVDNHVKPYSKNVIIFGLYILKSNAQSLLNIRIFYA
jgi:hypothetical protein